MSTAQDQISSRNTSEGPTPPIRRTRSANDLDTLSRNSTPATAVVSESGATESSGSVRQDSVPNVTTPLGIMDPPSSTAAAGGNNGDGPGPVRRFFSALGIGRGATQERKTQLSLVWNLCWGFAQVTTIATLSGLSGTVWKSPVYPDQTEWDACDRPLGIWACLWAGRVILASGLAYWDYKRSCARAAIQAAQNPAQMATQTGASSPAPATPGLFPLQQPSSPYETPGSGSTNSPNNNNNNDNIILPHNLLYSRLSLFLSLVTLSWFLTAHILQYTSLNTCRYTSPHVWWLTFGILCIMYLMVLEVILLGFIVLVVAPILFVFWNIFLFCIGRHPAQNPHMIKPDIGKLSKSIVDRIPLVMYIPPPPGSESNDNADNATTPTSPHAYPPISPSQQQQQPQTPPPKRSRFRFFKRKPSSKEAGATEQANGDTTNVDLEKGKVEQEVWEGNFEKGDYPFVVLEGNRAACAICLMDFEAPRRKDEVPPDAPTASSSSSPSRSPPPLADTNSAQPLKLTDSGEGAQPLRLLACGHVFHQTCLDPWLTDVSGRCPVCQRPVDVSELKKRKRRHR